MWHLRELPVHGGAGTRLAHSFAIGWSVPQPTFSGGQYEWPWAIGRGETPHHHHHHTSLIPVLSCCQSARWVCYSILLLLCWSVCFPWYITQMEFLVSKSGQIAFVDPADHHCNGHLRGTPQRCLISTDDEFDFCSFSALQGWCLKVNFEIPHKMFSRFIWNT